MIDCRREGGAGGEEGRERRREKVLRRLGTTWRSARTLRAHCGLRVGCVRCISVKAVPFASLAARIRYASEAVSTKWHLSPRSTDSHIFPLSTDSHLYPLSTGSHCAAACVTRQRLGRTQRTSRVLCSSLFHHSASAQDDLGGRRPKMLVPTRTLVLPAAIACAAMLVNSAAHAVNGSRVQHTASMVQECSTQCHWFKSAVTRTRQHG